MELADVDRLQIAVLGELPYCAVGQLVSLNLI